MRFALAFTITFYTTLAFAGNYSLEGTLKNGAIVGYESDPPGYVFIKKESKITVFDGELCGFIYTMNNETHRENRHPSFFSCDASGKSPLAGTKYEFTRRVGDNCSTQDDYEIFACIDGCSENAPKELIENDFCAP